MSSCPFLRAWSEFIDHQGSRECLLYIREKTGFPHGLWYAGRNVAESVTWPGANFFLFLLREHPHSELYVPYPCAHVIWFPLLFWGASSKWRQCRKLDSLLSSIKYGSTNAFSLVHVHHQECLLSLWYLIILFICCLGGVTCQTGPPVFVCCPIRHTFQIIVFLSPFELSSPFSPCRSPPQGGCLDSQFKLGSVFLRTSCASLW